MFGNFRFAAVSLCLIFASLLHAETSGPLTAASSFNLAGQSGGAANKQRPNILFIIMDDVGIDQMQIFGYGGGTPPLTPNINAIAHAGVRFRNVWSMPECSPSRAIFFEGRYPLRTNIQSAILSDDLANSQVSPFEVTTPEVLRTKNYMSALFGKFHLAGPDNNEFTYGTPHVLGWDYFDGFLEGAPHPIDTTIGGQFPVPSGPNPPPPMYTCGFIPNTTHSPNGSDHGACVQLDKSCTELTRSSTMPDPGFSCLQQRGIYVPDKSCAAAKNVSLDFTVDNAYYAWERVINKPDGTVIRIHPDKPSARGYVSDATVSAAVDWIKQQNAAKKPWMSTVAFANDHTPYQQPPAYLLPGPTVDSTGFACTGNTPQNVGATRVLSNQMIEAMDTEIGNLMVSAGLAQRNSNGTLDYHPEQTNTMVIIIGDNGTFAPGVKVPFDTQRAKGFVYQTGVWVPLIISGPLVASPDREVKSMVNIADLFQLFGEIAGADVRKIVPATHKLDSQPMLAYLMNPNQPSIRQTNFTQTDSNIHVVTPPPCVITVASQDTCVQLFNQAGICHFEGGKWYGTPTDDPQGRTFSSCCEVKRALYDPTKPPTDLTLVPLNQQATRDDNYKLVRKEVNVCAQAPNTNDTTQVLNEFYQINEDVLVPMIDKEGTALCGESDNCPTGLTDEQKTLFNHLTASMDATLGSETPCPGDGNLDKVVNLADVTNWFYFSTNGVPPVGGGPPNTSSWYDFNHDGKTDAADLKMIINNFGTHCKTKN
ncbi:MAG TPA: sulfatase-like hydrolase/transferase [Edaphobacter sp.]|nr:sulfatase-like hydrolase/transferase [Edaphobacter sp.]